MCSSLSAFNEFYRYCILTNCLKSLSILFIISSFSLISCNRFYSLVFGESSSELLYERLSSSLFPCLNLLSLVWEYCESFNLVVPALSAPRRDIPTAVVVVLASNCSVSASSLSPKSCLTQIAINLYFLSLIDIFFRVFLLLQSIKNSREAAGSILLSINVKPFFFLCYIHSYNNYPLN